LYNIFDTTSLGSLILTAYIIIDFIRNKFNKPKDVVRRLFSYSFIFYLLNLAQITTGGIIFPPQKDFGVKPQLIPFYFIFDWFVLYQRNGFDWFFWNSVKLSFYKFVMLIPLGIYLSLTQTSHINN
jgi:hypothetical protein